MIIKRKSFSKSKYAETATQARNRETTAAKSVAGLGLLGAGIAAKESLKAGSRKLTGKYTSAITKDMATRAKADRVISQIRSRGVRPEDVAAADKFINETINSKLVRNSFATNKLAANDSKKIFKAVGRNAAKGAAIGGIIGAGLYGLNRKNLIKQNEEKNRRLAKRRERLAGKQKES